MAGYEAPGGTGDRFAYASDSRGGSRTGGMMSGGFKGGGGGGGPLGGGGGGFITSGKGGGGGGGGNRSFTTDFSQLGSSSQSRIFGTGAGSAVSGVLDEERRSIEKIFSIVDKDHSGHIDMHELEDMFKLFKEDASLLTNTIQRIMKNVDKDFDGMISSNEFYALLSQRFEKDKDSRKDINACYMKMANKDGELDLNAMAGVAQKLGESCSKNELMEMMCMFSSDYQSRKKANDLLPADQQREVELPKTITIDEFYNIMQMEVI